MLTPTTLRSAAQTIALVSGAAIVTLLVSGVAIDTPNAWEWRAITMLALWPVFVVATGTMVTSRAFQSVGDAYAHGVETGLRQATVHRLHDRP